MAKASFSFEFDDRDGVLAKLEALGSEINQDDVMLDALTEGGEIVKSGVQSQAPVRTGVLQDSIEASPSMEDGPSVRVGPGNRGFYGRFLEHGTSKMSARPFMRPGFDGARVTAEAAIAAKLWEAVNSRV